MSARSWILGWAEQGLIRDVPHALRVAGVLPSSDDWRAFLDRLLLWSGALALAAAAVFFIAYNWNDLGRYAKFALVEVLIVCAVIGYWKLGANRAAGKASLMVAAILVGALLALFGQTYQTGADTWQLFATWGVLLAPWVIVGRFAPLWMSWLGLANVAIVLYFAARPDLLGFIFSTEGELWTLFVFDTLALIAWELAARRIAWLDARWAPRLLAVASGSAMTLLAMYALFDWPGASAAILLVYPTWIAGVYLAYRTRSPDVLMLAGACLSAIIVVTGGLTRVLFEHADAAIGFLLIAAAIIGMAACAGRWLTRVAREPRI
jgi:uncharacterized membrane protein